MKNTNKVLEFHNSLFDELKVAREVSYQLSDLSKVLRRAYQTGLADELSLLAGVLENSIKNISDAYSKDLNRTVREQQESTGKLFKALLELQ